MIEAPAAHWERLQETVAGIRTETARVIVGQEEIVEQLLTSLVCKGHCLLVGVPGLAKTLLVSTLGRVLGLKFQRIQFTPDLMPTDIVGSEILRNSPDGERSFQFVPGPVFAHLILADEINRTPPKTQAALLEAMQEKQVTVNGQTRRLEEPFIVFATQNPIEHEGTYPLPEAQLDRFFVKLLVRYPRPEDLETILDRTTGTAQPTAAPVLCGTRIQEMSALARTIPIAKEVQRHAIALVTATHPEQQSATQTARRYIRYGASPRGLQALILGAKIRAILDGRCHVATADLHQMALPVLRHRIILNFEGQAEGVSTDDVIQRILGQLSDSSSAGIR